MKKLIPMMAIQGVAIIAFAQGSEPFIPISMQPEGTVRAYFRSGMASVRGTNVPVEQFTTMAMNVCFAPDGKTVYLQNPISGAYLDTWVRGELDEDGVTLRVPLPQAMWWYDSFGYGNMLAMVDLSITSSGISAFYDPSITEVTYTFDGDELRLNGTSETKALGMVFTDDHSCVGMNDWASVYHYEGDEMVQVPAEAKRTRYVASGMNQDREYEENIYAEVATLGDNVWLKGYTQSAPTAWIHGTRQDDKVHFAKNQLIGTYGGYPLFFCSNNDNDVADATFSYDAETQTYKADGFIFVNTRKDQILHFGYFRSLEYKPASQHDGAYQISTDPIVRKQPVGTEQTMMRSGLAYFYNYNGDYIAYTSQGGMPIKLVYADDDETVWMLNPVSYCAEDTWVKGRLDADGTHITVPLGQQLYYDPTEGWGYATALLRWNPDKRSFDIDEDVAEITFSIHDDHIVLDGCDGSAIYGVIYTDDYSWTGYGDYNTVYSPAPESIAQLPAGVEPSLWSISYTDYQGNYGGRLLNVVIQGDQLWISNLTDQDPEAAVVGTIVGDSVRFLSGQYIGKGAGYYSFFDAGRRIQVYDREDQMYYYDYDYAPSVTLAYDAERQRLTAGEDDVLMIDAGRGQDAVSYVVVWGQPLISVYVERPAIPEDPQFLSYDDELYADEGYCTANLLIRPYDVDGNVIRLDRLYYRLYTQLMGERDVYTFFEDEYQSLQQDMTLIPYTFSDDYDFGRGGSFIFLYQYGHHDYGVQVVNMSGGEERCSNIVWYKAGVEPGTGSQAISTIRSDAAMQPVYNLHGQRIHQAQPGQIVISNGQVQAVK